MDKNTELKQRTVKRAVITGPTGVVGSALVRECAENGMDLYLLLRRGSERNACLLKEAATLTGAAPEEDGADVLFRGEEGRPSIRISYCALHELKDLPSRGEAAYDIFFHLGWSGTKGADRFDPYIHTANVGYALDAAALAARLGCHTFVGAGSQAECGRTDEKLTPRTLPRPENAYGIGKLAACHMTREYAHALGLRHVWTRILSVYGPNDGEKTLITYLIRSLLGGECPKATKGEQIWDYLYSADAARALRLIGERGRDGGIYLVASGKERRLSDYMAELLSEVAPGGSIDLGAVPYGERQVMHLAADITETTRDTGFVPEISFAEGVRRMAEEMRASIKQDT